MKTSAYNSALQGAAHESMLPIHSMSAQTRHILQAHGTGHAHNRRILYVFALVLTFAIACALLLVVSSGTAYAAPFSATSAYVGETTIAAAAGFSLSASVLVAFAVIHLATSRLR